MSTEEIPTAEQSLALLSEAIGKASVDLLAVRAAIDRARAEMAGRQTAIPRDIVRQADRAINHLRQTDEYLQGVLEDLSERH